MLSKEDLILSNQKLREALNAEPFDGPHLSDEQLCRFLIEEWAAKQTRQETSYGKGSKETSDSKIKDSF